MASIPLEDEFADIVAKARLAQSPEEVAKAAGVSEQDLRALENYERQPTEHEARALARVLNLDADRLLAVANGTWSPAKETVDGDAQAQVIRLKNFVGGYPVFSYLLVCRDTQEAAVVDTAADPDQILDELRKRALTPKAIFVTHDHADHVEGLGQIQKSLGVPVVTGDGVEALRNVGEQVRLVDGETYRIGNLEVRLAKTPGHSAGCATFVAGSVAFSGDTIFAGSVGRPNHSYEAIRSSILDKLFTLPDSTRLYPGHGPSTTVGEERAHNPFFG